MKNPDKRKMVKHLKLLCQKNKNGVEEAKAYFLTDNKGADQNLD